MHQLLPQQRQEHHPQKQVQQQQQERHPQKQMQQQQQQQGLPKHHPQKLMQQQEQVGEKVGQESLIQLLLPLLSLQQQPQLQEKGG